jgi:hypothetical protein
MTEPSEKPITLKLVLGLLALEALAIVAVLVVLILELIEGRSENLLSSIFLIVLAAAAVSWVALFTRELFRGKRWARSAAVFWQLLQATVGAGAITESGTNQALGFLIVLVAGATMVLLFTPSVVQAKNTFVGSSIHALSAVGTVLFMNPEVFVCKQREIQRVGLLELSHFRNRIWGYSNYFVAKSSKCS